MFLVVKLWRLQLYIMTQLQENLFFHGRMHSHNLDTSYVLDKIGEMPLVLPLLFNLGTDDDMPLASNWLGIDITRLLSHR